MRAESENGMAGVVRREGTTRNSEADDESDEKREGKRNECTWRAFRAFSPLHIIASCTHVPDLYSSRVHPPVRSPSVEKKRKRQDE